MDNTGRAPDPGFDELPGAVIAYDEHGRVVRANPAALEILGFQSERELVGSLAAGAGWFRTDPAGWPDAQNLHPVLAAIRSGEPARRSPPSWRPPGSTLLRSSRLSPAR